jgi:SAM-dependent methyltransferase
MGSAPGTWGIRSCGSEACGTAWLDPMPAPEDLARCYEGYFTHGAEARAPSALARAARAGRLAGRFGYRGAGTPARLLGALVALVPSRRAAMDLSAFHLPFLPGGRLLEVGCGSGEMLAGMRDLGWEVEGVDFDPGAVAAARGRGLAVREGDLASCRFPGASFDAVAMVHVVEHVPDPRALLAEAARVLRPGGRLSVVTPNPRGRGARLFGAAWREWDPPRHLALLPLPTLRRLVEEAGLRAERAGTTLREAGAIHLGSRRIAREGRFRLEDRPRGAARLAAAAWTLGGALALLLDGESGDETVVTASKAATSSGRA